MNKHNVLFWIFFVILLGIMFYVYRIFIEEFVYTFVMSTWIDIVLILIFLIVIIPLTAYLSERLATYSFYKGLEKGKNFTIFISAIIIVPTILLSIIKVNEYKEKALDDVISYQPAKVDTITINYDVTTDEKEDAEALKAFLSDYRVKKMKNRDWDSDVSDQDGFSITIYSKGKPIMASIYENRLSFYNNDSYYKVLNGPIDIEWVEERLYDGEEE